MGNIRTVNGFSSSNIKQNQKKNSSNKTTEISDILKTTKKNTSKEMNANNSKENDIKIKNTRIKNKISSAVVFSNKNNNLETNTRNNLINELKRRRQYLNKQIKYFLTNDSSKFSNNFLNYNSDKRKLLNSSSNSKNNIKESENNNKKLNQDKRDMKITKYIKINI